MKKNRLNFISSLLSVFALCGVFSICLFEKSNDVEKVNAISTSVPSLDTYTPYEIYDGSFYFDWSFITYDVSSSDSNSNIQNRNVYRQLSSTPTDLYGLVYVFNVGNDENIYSQMNNQFYGIVTDFYSYYYDVNNYGNTVFEKYRQLSFMSIGNTSDEHMRIEYFYGTGGQDYRLIYDNLDTYKWKFGYARNLIFVSHYTDSARISLLERFGTFYQFYEFNSLIHQVSDLESEISSLENEISDLEGDVSSLSNQITSLNNQISDLRSQLSSAVINTRRDTYVVSINAELIYSFQIFVNVDYQSNQDFYVKPINISCNSRIEVFDCTGSLVEYHNNVVDVLDFSNVDVYYYQYSDLYNYLYIDIGDDWLLNIPYVDNDDVTTFSLTNINYYISDWLLDYKSDLSYSDFAYSRRTFVNYNNLISGALGGTNMAYLDGFDAGIVQGYLQGKQDGYSQGVSDGFVAGSEQDSTVATIFSGILQVGLLPINMFLRMFNFEILGINMSSFISAILTICITIIVIKTIFGKGGGE